MSEHKNWILVGLTGSIATGKSTVADLFQDQGADLIDFDLLSRSVVEPDRPAWRDIVDYFGESVLLENRTLDRKQLSGIVFNNEEKRKKLESFTHPRIQEEYKDALRRITSNDPNAIVMAVVPLLIEVGMVSQFEKILVVTANPQTQLERLLARDGITRKEATKIIESQMPVEDKVSYADYVIDNGRSIEHTRKQVKSVWGQLRALQG